MSLKHLILDIDHTLLFNKELTVDTPVEEYTKSIIFQVSSKKKRRSH